MQTVLSLSLATATLLGAVACSQSKDEPAITAKELSGSTQVDITSLSKTLATRTEYNLESDSLVLVSLYKAMGGGDWFRNSYWLSDVPLRHWQGVHVKAVDGQERVYALYVGGNNLRGTIPTTIKYLTALRVLHLKHNYHIDGTIPEGIYELTKLKTLDMSFTGLTGKLSPKVGQLTELDSLNLWTGPWDLRKSGNFLPNPRRLSGELPKELGKLTKARYISVYNQGFSGLIPAELGNLTSVEELSLQGNAFSGTIPAELGQLQKVKKLYLGSNQLTGSIPSNLCSALAIEELIISNNQLEGGLPKGIEKWQRLNLLELNNNKLSGNLPEELTQMKDLFKIDIRNNQFEGSLPATLGGAQQDFLRFVDIRGNNFSGELPQKVKHKLRNLVPNGIYPFPKEFYTEFRITGNRFAGTLPTSYQDVHREYILPQQAGYGFANYK